MKTISFIFVTILLTGCPSKNLNQDIYNALLQRECIQKTGEPNCESGQLGYEEYRREREEIIQEQ